MCVFHTSKHPIVVPEGHKFPKNKYKMLFQKARSEFAQRIQLLDAPETTIQDLCKAHKLTYVQKVLGGLLNAQEERELGFPWSESLAIRARHSVGATIRASLRAVEQDGISINLGGGAHHAKSQQAAGFCIFNDVAVAALKVYLARRLGRVLIVDCDVHQGDGTAEILARYPSIYTFSIHATRNYPRRKMTSDFDIGLPDGTSDQTYLSKLRWGLSEIFRQFRPNFMIYIAGADVYKGDRLGRFTLSKQGISDRDHTVLRLASDREIPIALVMGGGYATEVSDTIDIHLQTISNALEYFDRYNE